MTKKFLHCIIQYSCGFIIIMGINLFQLSFAIKNEDIVSVDSRIKSFIYNENDVFDLHFKTGYQSILELGRDESVEAIVLGDPYPWKVTPLERRIFIKPTEPGVRTNMTVITNKRIYYFEISSDLGSAETSSGVTHVTRFYYPTITVDRLENPGFIPGSNKSKDIAESKRTTDSLSSINLSYTLIGKTNKATPIEVFDDKRKTYLRFKDKKMNYNKLKIYTINSKRNRTNLKFRKTGDFVVLNGVFNKIGVDYEGASIQIENDILAL